MLYIRPIPPTKENQSQLMVRVDLHQGNLSLAMPLQGWHGHLDVTGARQTMESNRGVCKCVRKRHAAAKIGQVCLVYAPSTSNIMKIII